MIYIDDAGTGCFIGKSIIVGYNDITKDIVVEFLDKDNQENTAKAGFNILNKLNIDKSETIKICRGFLFNYFQKEAEEKGYKIERVVIDGDMQHITEDLFQESLYKIGVSTNVKLKGKDYGDFHKQVINDLYLKPHLLKFVKPSIKNNINILKITRKIERFCLDYPNLYNILKKEEGE